MQTTPVPEEGCDECYMLGVLCALAGSSFQAVGLSLWKLQHIRNEKAEEARLAFVRIHEHRIASATSGGITSAESAPTPQQLQTCEDKDRRTQSAPCASSVSLDARELSFRSNRRIESASNTDGIEEKMPPNHGDIEVKIEASEPPVQELSNDKDRQHSTGLKFQNCGIWIVGFILFFIGNVGDFIALGITRQSVVTLVGSWCLVVNTVTARCLLHEIVHPLDVVSSVLIIGGIVLTVFFSAKESPEWPLERVVEQYRKPPVVVMLSILASAIFVGLAIMHLDYVKRKRKAKATQCVLAKPSRTIGALYCVVGSLVADFTVLFGKAFSGLLLPTLTGDNQFTSPFVVLIVLVFCVSLPSQIYLIDQSLTVNDALYHIPNFYVFWNVGSIVTGAIYYEEMSNFGLANWLGFFSGVGVLFLGVFVTNVAAGKKQLLIEEEEKKRMWTAGHDGAGPGMEYAVRHSYLGEEHYRVTRGPIEDENSSHATGKGALYTDVLNDGPRLRRVPSSSLRAGSTLDDVDLNICPDAVSEGKVWTPLCVTELRLNATGDRAGDESGRNVHGEPATVGSDIVREITRATSGDLATLCFAVAAQTTTAEFEQEGVVMAGDGVRRASIWSEESPNVTGVPEAEPHPLLFEAAEKEESSPLLP